MDIIDILIDKLNERKNELGIKNVDLSQQTGISTSHLSDILNKKSNTTIDKLNKIAECLSLNLNFSLISDEGVEYTVSTEVKELTSKYLGDFSTWSATDKEDVIDYLKSKRRIIDLRKKDKAN